MVVVGNSLYKGSKWAQMQKEMQGLQGLPLLMIDPQANQACRMNNDEKVANEN